ncbi:MAG: hypothetical protein RIT35_319 [Pseudomonadota bacterium]
MNLINPRVDIAFKKIFGVEENKDILIHPCKSRNKARVFK